MLRCHRRSDSSTSTRPAGNETVVVLPQSLAEEVYLRPRANSVLELLHFLCFVVIIGINVNEAHDQEQRNKRDETTPCSHGELATVSGVSVRFQLTT